MFKAYFFSCILFVGAGYGFSKVPSKQSEVLQEALGVRTLTYIDESRSRPVTIELWYPTHAAEVSKESEDSLWIHPEEARDAPLDSTSASFPLVVMSHGHRGERRDRSWLAEVLVRNGYVVASIEHFGNTREFYSPLMSLRFWERPRDVTFVIDQLLNEPFLKERIDTNRIGFVGYSLGGMTGLSLAGATAKNVKEALLKHKKRLGLQPTWLEGIDFSDAEISFKEERIRAFLLICPAIFIFPSDSLKEVKVPIGLVASLDDEVLPHKEHAYQIIQHLIPSKLKMMRDKVSHYAFLNKPTEKGQIFFQKKPPHPSYQDKIHQEVAGFAVSFFDEALPQDHNE